MSIETHTIETQSDVLPPLTLSSASLPSWDERYSYSVGEMPSAIEPIEHQLRLDARLAGKQLAIPLGKELLESYNSYSVDPDTAPDPWDQKPVGQKPLVVDYMERTCEERLESEARFFENFDDDAIINQAPEYLKYELRQAREAEDPEAEVEEIRANRENWYEEVIPWRNIYAMMTENSIGSLVQMGQSSTFEGIANQYKGVVVVSNSTDPRRFAEDRGISPEFVLRVSEAISNFDPEVCHPADYGVELPAPLVVGEYDSGSTYCLIPWSDALVCSCPFKQRHSWRCMCKHELYTSLCLGNRGEKMVPIDQGLNVPDRCRRFFGPDAFANRDPARI
jgi:hypothetical protein